MRFFPEELGVYWLAVALTGAGGVWLINEARRQHARAKSAAHTLFRDIMPLLPGSEPRAAATAGTWVLEGSYKGQPVQLKAVADTLSMRKLPSLWLLVTLAKPQPVEAVLDLMMRPAGITTFSNFDDLPDTVATPPGFPSQAVLRSTNSARAPGPSVLAPHLDIMRDRRGKEFLISPKGLRIVVQAAEADRVRYGVLREANFYETTLDAVLTQRSLECLLALQKDLAKSYGG